MATNKKSRSSARSPITAPRPAPSTGTSSRIERLRELVSVLEGSTLAELHYEDEDLAVTLVRSSRPAVGHSTPHVVEVPALAAPVMVAAPAAVPSVPPPPPPAAEAEGVVVKSPFVGTFYRAPKPGQPNFTDVGERVHRGKVLCIIEAMKLMNEIESEVDGTVVEVLVDNGQPVQYGDPLFRIRKG